MSSPGAGLNKENRMKYRRFGRTGFMVSEISQGLWGMGGWSGSDDKESLDAMQLAIDLGCNFFDSAWAYGDGKSDSLLGEILSRNRGKQLFAASKVPPMNRKWPARAHHQYREVFPEAHVLEGRRNDSQEFTRGSDRPAAVSRVVGSLGTRAGIPRDREEIEKRRADSIFRNQLESLGTRERHEGNRNGVD